MPEDPKLKIKKLVDAYKKYTTPEPGAPVPERTEEREKPVEEASPTRKTGTTR